VTRVFYRIQVLSFDQRSQHRNKQIALFRLMEKLEKLAVDNASKEMQKRWREGKNVQRGDAVLVFEGEGFRLKI